MFYHSKKPELHSKKNGPIHSKNHGHYTYRENDNDYQRKGKTDNTMAKISNRQTCRK